MNMREHLLAQCPEEDNVQGRTQERSACYLADERPRQPGLRKLRCDIDESQQAKHETRAASTPAYLPTDGKAAMFRFE